MAGNPHCQTCGVMLYTATRHTVAGQDYCVQHCPRGCAPDSQPSPFTSDCAALVERAKRGSRRGTPVSWAMRGVGS